MQIDNYYNKIVDMSEYKIDIRNDRNLMSLECSSATTLHVNLENLHNLNVLDISCDLDNLNLEGLNMLLSLKLIYNIHQLVRVVNCDRLSSIISENNTSIPTNRVYIRSCASLKHLDLGYISQEFVCIDCPKLESVSFKSENRNISVTVSDCPNLYNFNLPSDIGEFNCVNCPQIARQTSINSLNIDYMFSDLKIS